MIYTKSDISTVIPDAIREEISNLRIELKEEIKEIRRENIEIRKEISDIRTETRKEISDLKNRGESRYFESWYENS